MLIRLLLLASSLLAATEASSTVLLGSGFNSATTGRIIPTLNFGIGTKSFEVQGLSTGVSTTAYFHSVYRLSGYWVWNAGDFFIGRVEAGFGPGLLYSVREFSDTDSSQESKTDWVVGPTFFVRWILVGPLYISVDALYGLFGPSSKNGDLIGLNARDNASFSIGVIW